MEITGDVSADSRPWDNAIQKGQMQVRRSWLLAAEELEKQEKPEEADLSKHIREMVAAMSPVETERDRIKRELLERFGSKKEAVSHAPDVQEKQPADRIVQKMGAGFRAIA